MDLPQLNNLLIDVNAYKWIRAKFKSVDGLKQAAKDRHLEARQFIYHIFFSSRRIPPFPGSYSDRKKQFKQFFYGSTSIQE
jgi:hypothetical protein